MRKSGTSRHYRNVITYQRAQKVAAVALDNKFIKDRNVGIDIIHVPYMYVERKCQSDAILEFQVLDVFEWVSTRILNNNILLQHGDMQMLPMSSTIIKTSANYFSFFCDPNYYTRIGYQENRFQHMAVHVILETPTSGVTFTNENNIEEELHEGDMVTSFYGEPILYKMAPHKLFDLIILCFIGRFVDFQKKFIWL